MRFVVSILRVLKSLSYHRQNALTSFLWLQFWELIVFHRLEKRGLSRCLVSSNLTSTQISVPTSGSALHLNLSRKLTADCLVRTTVFWICCQLRLRQTTPRVPQLFWICGMRIGSNSANFIESAGFNHRVSITASYARLSRGLSQSYGRTPHHHRHPPRSLWLASWSCWSRTGCSYCHRAC